jgi:hypothetical protein
MDKICYDRIMRHLNASNLINNFLFSYVTPLAKALAPSYLRVGGSGADHITYVVSPDITTTNDNYAFTGYFMKKVG